MPDKKQQDKQKRSDALLSQARVPPYSIEAEQSVLGGVMLDNMTWDRIAGKLQHADFYRRDHQIIFSAIERLAHKDQPFDILTLSEALKTAGELDAAGGETYLYELANNTPSAANVGAYADIVRERAVLRQLISTAGEIAELACDPKGQSSKDILDIAEREIFSIHRQGAHHQSGPVSLTTLLSTATDRIDAICQSGSTVTGLQTGFVDLDKMTSGLQAGDMVIVAGRPSMGKTAFMMNMAEHVAISESKPVLVFSMEMPGEMLAMRMISSLGRVDHHKIRSGQLGDDDWPRVTSAVSMLSGAKMFIDDTPALTPTDMRTRARRLVREHGPLAMIGLDYLQLMRVPGSGDNRTLEISEISRSIKALARELEVPIVALSQLNRSLESRQDRRPMMSDLRESGAIEQDADVIAFVYRDEVYNDDSPDKGTAEIIIAKQRNGPIGKVRLTFLGQYTRFENFSPMTFAESLSGAHNESAAPSDY